MSTQDFMTNIRWVVLAILISTTSFGVIYYKASIWERVPILRSLQNVLREGSGQVMLDGFGSELM
jgi:hypothetical protein